MAEDTAPPEQLLDLGSDHALERVPYPGEGAPLAGYVLRHKSAIDGSPCGCFLAFSEPHSAAGTQLVVGQSGQSTLACGMAEPSADIMRLYPEEFLAPSRRSVFSFPVTGTDVLPDDRIIVGGRTYRVQADASHDSYQTLLQVIASQVGTIA